MAATFVDSTAALKAFLDNLPDCRGQPPKLYIDLEGNNLSRDGTISLMTILVHPQKSAFIIDLTNLKNTAFTTTSTLGTQSIKSLLEADDTFKVFFDIRHDSDALFAHYGIELQKVEDLQLMEYATRPTNNGRLNGLAKCIDYDSGMSFYEKREFSRVKERGLDLFAPERGGSYAVFDQRPLTPEILTYCAQDVLYMPALRSKYVPRLNDGWYRRILAESEARVRLSQSLSFNSKGQHMAIGPANWLFWTSWSDEDRRSTLFRS